MRSSNNKGLLLSSGAAVFLLVHALLVIGVTQSACTDFEEKPIDVIEETVAGKDTNHHVDPVEDTAETEPDAEEEGEDILAQGEDVLAQGEDTLAQGEDTLAPADSGRPDPDVDQEPEIIGSPDALSIEDDIDDGPGCPGGVGCDCEEPDECFSRFCVPTSEGSKCARMCSGGSDCKDDQVCTLFRGTGGPDTFYVCLDRTPTACRPCVVDTDCAVGWLDDDEQPLCINDEGGGKYCAPIPRDEAPECPDGFVVGMRDIGDVATPVCLVEAGVCECTGPWLKSGAETECSISNEFGTCTARHLCNQPCTAATPSAETCDGFDNNCDGRIDENLDNSACSIDNDFGSCPGLLSCRGGVGVCSGTSPAAEQCNNIDDDCDGLVDESLGTKICGRGVCMRLINRCQDGAWAECDPYVGASSEKCNGKDDDCDGETDESLGTSTCGKGVCARTVQSCVAGHVNTCVPLNVGSTEVCDDKDNDCDGSTDEGFGLVTCGKGECQHTINECIDGKKFTCNPLEGAIAETCNGADDDCDGITDDSLKTPETLHEPNDSLIFAQKLGIITEGKPTSTFNSYAYMGEDKDWFEFTADEIDHSCAWGTDQDYKLFVAVYSPVGPEPCIPLFVELFDGMGNPLMGPVLAQCTGAVFEYKWDGECGPDDSKDFMIEVRPVYKEKYSCLNYTINLTMKKI